MTSARPRNPFSQEMIEWLQEQVRDLSERESLTAGQLEQLYRQLYTLAEQVVEVERDVRELPPRFIPFQGLPDKLQELEEAHERVRHDVVGNRNEIDNALRLIAAESQYDREERAEIARRLDSAVAQISVVTADTARVQSQAVQLGQTMQSILDRQKDVEDAANHIALRLERVIEVNQDMESRLRQEFADHQDDRFEVVFERLQVVGEMVRRSEEVIQAVANERSIREDVIEEFSLWRDQQGRIESRLAALEEASERVLGDIDRVSSDLTLLEGRHSGLGERVASIRKDIAEVVDHVRDEFTKYSKMMEKQRRAQIGVLEQELREMKFHTFRPPEEP